MQQQPLRLGLGRRDQRQHAGLGGDAHDRRAFLEGPDPDIAAHIGVAGIVQDGGKGPDVFAIERGARDLAMGIGDPHKVILADIGDGQRSEGGAQTINSCLVGLSGSAPAHICIGGIGKRG